MLRVSTRQDTISTHTHTNTHAAHHPNRAGAHPTAEEAAAHDALPGGLDALRQHEPEFVARVERLLDGVRAQVMY